MLVLAAQVLSLEEEIRDLQATAARVPLLEGEIRDLQATAARVPLLEGEIRDLQATAARGLSGGGNFESRQPIGDNFPLQIMDLDKTSKGCR